MPIARASALSSCGYFDVSHSTQKRVNLASLGGLYEVQMYFKNTQNLEVSALKVQDFLSIVLNGVVGEKQPKSYGLFVPYPLRS